MNINDYLKKHLAFRSGAGYQFKELTPAVFCKDGLTMSVQASSYHYCTPHQDDAVYTTVEVGFPNMRVPELLPYAEEPNNPTETVYAQVPVELVEAIIEKHGGLND